ncbi:MAG: hypothetical protein K0R92_1089 [Lachnospiraceae bacterium]|jgi:biotin transport system substrate-specific component|nr:hypothetical protein [Lachnospiraceae bacterium]
MKNETLDNQKASIQTMTIKSNTQLKAIVQTAMFASIIVILSQIAIPLPFGVPITLQTFAIALCGYVLGLKFGLLSTAVYIMLGAIGLPVFANFKGGFQALFGMTGGFIFGFLFLVGFCGLHIKFRNKMLGVLLGILGLAMCHILGVIQFSAVTSTPLGESLFFVSFPFLVKDIISIVAAYFISLVVRKRLLEAQILN